jgi:C1A family cysteine protease
MRVYLRFLTVFTILLLISGIFIQSIYADKAELDKIKKAIKDKGADWEADENNVSQLVPQDRKLRLGAILDQSNEINKANKDLPDVSGLPASFDWRNNHGNWVTSVKDQGDCGGCWAFGSIAALESLTLITRNTPDRVGTKDMIDLSEQDLVSCCTESNGYKCYGCKYAYVNEAYRFLQDFGVPNEKCFPYQALELDCNLRCPNWANNAIKISSWTRVTQDVNSLKAAIAKHPITACFNVFSDFYYYRKGVYKNVSGEIVGGHTICIVGWNDKNQCFIVKNSWGPKWGESGYFRIAYSQIDNSVRFGQVAGDFEMKRAKMAPSAYTDTSTTLWGYIKEL